MTRWTVRVARRTDIDLRSYLAEQGRKKGDLSAFIVDAVKWRLFDLNLNEARAGFSNLEVHQMDTMIDEAVEAARTS